MLTLLYRYCRYIEHVWYKLLKRNSMYDVNVSDNTEQKESNLQHYYTSRTRAAAITWHARYPLHRYICRERACSITCRNMSLYNDHERNIMLFVDAKICMPKLC